MNQTAGSHQAPPTNEAPPTSEPYGSNRTQASSAPTVQANNHAASQRSAGEAGTQHAAAAAANQGKPKPTKSDSSIQADVGQDRPDHVAGQGVPSSPGTPKKSVMKADTGIQADVDVENKPPGAANNLMTHGRMESGAPPQNNNKARASNKVESGIQADVDSELPRHPHQPSASASSTPQKSTGAKVESGIQADMGPATSQAMLPLNAHKTSGNDRPEGAANAPIGAGNAPMGAQWKRQSASGLRESGGGASLGERFQEKMGGDGGLPFGERTPHAGTLVCFAFFFGVCVCVCMDACGGCVLCLK
jgi:hypothetical protein